MNKYTPERLAEQKRQIALRDSWDCKSEYQEALGEIEHCHDSIWNHLKSIGVQTEKGKSLTDTLDGMKNTGKDLAEALRHLRWCLAFIDCTVPEAKDGSGKEDLRAARAFMEKHKC